MKFKKTLYNTRVKCLICERQIPMLYPPEGGPAPWNFFEALHDVLEYHAYHDWLDETEKRQPGHMTSTMVNCGAINAFSCGYGSSHDSDVFIIALCDSCIENRKNSSLIYDHNSMFLDEDE